MTMARANPVAEVAGRLRWPTYSKVRRRLHQRRLIRRSA